MWGRFTVDVSTSQESSINEAEKEEGQIIHGVGCGVKYYYVPSCTAGQMTLDGVS